MQHQSPDNRLPVSTGKAHTGHTRLVILIVLVLAILAGAAYLRSAWIRYQSMKEAEAIELAQSVAALLPTEHLVNLLGDIHNELNPSLGIVESALFGLVETSPLLEYAYLIGEVEGKNIVVADSMSSSSPLKKTRQSCEEADNVNLLPLQAGGSMLTKPLTTPCGTWIRVLVPIQSPTGGAILATLGLSYAAGQWQAGLWQRMVPDIVIAAGLVVLALALLRLWLEQADLKEKSRKLAVAQVLYQSIFQQAPIGIILQSNKRGALQSQFISINPMAEKILGRSVSEMANMKWTQITHPDDVGEELEQFERFVNGEIAGYSIEKRVIKPDGSTVWVNVMIADFSSEPLHNSMYLCLLEDISMRREARDALIESERSKSVLLSHLPGMAYRTRYDYDWTVEFASEGCRALTGYAPEDLLYSKVLSYNDMISPEYRELLRNEWERVLPQRKNFRAEYELLTKSGERKWVLELGQGIYDANGNVEALEGIVLDISERKRWESRIHYLSEHDFLTGLYNRSHLELEQKRLSQPEHLPLSVVACNIDGLSMINDAYGHAQGDRLIVETAKLIQSCCRRNDVLARVSGDEFLLLMPRTGAQEAHRRTEEIVATIEGYNRAGNQPLYEMSLSIGYGVMEQDEQSVEDALKTAQEQMKRRKLLNQKSSHHAILSSVMATLYAKSQETEEHGQRLSGFTRMIGERMGLGQKQLDDLQLLSMLHDIGKIGVDDSILNKPDKLNPEEWEQMKQHPVIGQRIAMSTPQLEHIADYILHHHERWDGKGYPVGLKGTEIPLVSRILAVADAYDAMIEDRVYRKALSWEAAIQEIRRCAGTQFDPQIATLFAEMICAQKDGCGITK